MSIGITLILCTTILATTDLRLKDGKVAVFEVDLSSAHKARMNRCYEQTEQVHD